MVELTDKSFIKMFEYPNFPCQMICWEKHHSIATYQIIINVFEYYGFNYLHPCFYREYADGATDLGVCNYIYSHAIPIPKVIQFTPKDANYIKGLEVVRVVVDYPDVGHIEWVDDKFITVRFDNDIQLYDYKHAFDVLRIKGMAYNSNTIIPLPFGYLPEIEDINNIEPIILRKEYC